MRGAWSTIVAGLVAASLLSTLTATGAGAARAGSLDRAWRTSAPDSPTGIAADADGAAVSGDGEMHVVDRDGIVLWSAWFGQGTEIGPVALGSQLVVVPLDRNRYLALGRADGQQRWERLTADAGTAAIGVDAQGRSVVGALSRTSVLEILDGETGRPRWRVQLPAVGRSWATGLWFGKGLAIAAWSDAEASRIRAFDVDAGTLVWGDDRRSYSTFPAVTADAVVFVVNDGRSDPRRLRGRVHDLDLATGAERWARDIHGLFAPSLHTAANTHVVAVVDVRGTITAMRARTGTVRWRERTRLQQAEAQPRIVGGAIAMTTYDTGVEAFEIRDGARVSNDDPGPVQTEVTIVASAATGLRMYLVVQIGRVRGELWMLETTEG
jgi:outer membrane protein assembly factor BamB